MKKMTMKKIIMDFINNKENKESVNDTFTVISDFNGEFITVCHNDYQVFGVIDLEKNVLRINGHYSDKDMKNLLNGKPIKYVEDLSKVLIDLINMVKEEKLVQKIIFETDYFKTLGCYSI